MTSENSTVELPADPRIKQLAHDIVREDDGWTVPLLLDFHQFLSAFDPDDHRTANELCSAVEERSDLNANNWLVHLDEFEAAEYIERHPGSNTTYTTGEKAEDE